MAKTNLTCFTFHGIIVKYLREINNILIPRSFKLITIVLLLNKGIITFNKTEIKKFKISDNIFVITGISNLIINSLRN